ncbi:hypothetical protein TrVE_jg104 [Triparma verrucosa]|uniref:PUA domain-containing protein n=1 Tax=Triparma verrucosa TaxID=1606542 RepID=A0A9W7FDQ6_9STRA|nr:hypothetical protein TrVE_jg104 [Triparma verrucosa]
MSFKRFQSSDCSTSTPVKASVQRYLKSSLVESNPLLAPHIDSLIPKKPPLTAYKVTSFLTLYTLNSLPILFETRDGPVLPTLRFVHQYPSLFTSCRVDSGAIPFILGGANIMCPGLVNPGSELNEDYEIGQSVVVYAEGKEHALAVGHLKMGAKEIKEVNKGMGCEVAHFIGDGLFETKSIE